MVYVFGSRLYGKVDNVKGLFHVATKFGHFDYFPLFPMGSWVYQKTPYRKVVIVTADFVTGHHVAGAFRAGFTGVGGEIVKIISTG